MDNIHLIQLNEYERPTITEERNRNWVGIGENNDYYQYLIDAYMDSTTNNAVINGIVNLIYGKGLDATDSSKKPEQYAQMKSLLKPKDLRCVAQDLKLLGEASFQITYNKNKISAITHFPRETLRAEKMDEKGNINNYYYAPDWSKVTKSTKLKKFPVFGSGAQNEIYIVKRSLTGFYYYSPADYQTAYAVLEKEVADYLINDTQNGFSGTKVVNFNNGVPDREKQLQIKNDVLSKLTGSYGEKTIIAFNNNAESATTITDIPLNDAPAHYEYLSTECQTKIMVTHRVTSPLLLGLGSANGFSSNADEIKNATLLFDNIVIKPYQHLIIDALDEIFAYNDISLNLYFKTLEPLEFMELDDVVSDEQREEETGVKEETELELLASTPKNVDLPQEIYNTVLKGLKGEVIDDDWEIADTRLYDEDNMSVDDWANEMITLSKGGDNKNGEMEWNEDGFSTLDKSFYKVRYKYVVGSQKKYKETKNKKGKVTKKNKSRDFCVAMMARTRQGIVYRLEDIDKASRDMSFNAAKLPMHNGEKFSLFKFKGGVYCRHAWKEVLYKLKQPLIDKGEKSDLITDHKKVTSIPTSYMPKPRGREQAKKAPVNMPNNGHHPSYVAPIKKKK